jgi:hydrogenase maturation protease
MTRATRPRILIIGVGNAYRSDDAVGLFVARRLREEMHLQTNQTTIQEESGEGTALIEAWQEAEAVIVIDAVRSGAPPGSVHRFDASQQALPAVFSCASTHAFGLAEALEMARALQQLPSRLIVYGIEGENFAAGMELSPAVEHAIHIVVERIRTEVEVSKECSHA